MNMTKVTICECKFRNFIDKKAVAELAFQLKAAGRDVTIVPDLCECALSAPEKMAEISRSTVVACYPRAIASMFRWQGIAAPSSLNIRTGSVAEILKALDAERVADSNEQSDDAESIQPQAAEAWFPIIDKDRCTDCGQCHDFCLFGVYTLDDGCVKVANPRNCKNNCPACARVCPQKAIIFPKYEKSPINGGLADEETGLKFDTKELYAGALKLKLDERRTKISLLKDKK